MYVRLTCTVPFVLLLRYAQASTVVHLGYTGTHRWFLHEHAMHLLVFVFVLEQNGHISQWFPRFDFARREGWLNRSIPCLGMLFGKSDLNPTGWTKAELRATMQELKEKYGHCRCLLLVL